MLGWYTVPPGADGAEMRVDIRDRSTRRVTVVRALRGGRLLAWDPYRGRYIEARDHWANLGEATTIAIGLVIEIDMLEDARREIEARERDRKRGFSRDTTSDRDEVRELRRRLDDPARVVALLGLEKGARRQPRGLLVRCPVHADRTPSCSVRVASDGTISAHCHGCSWSGDVLGLVAAVHQLDVRRDFRRVLEIAADMAGVTLRRAS